MDTPLAFPPPIYCIPYFLTAPLFPFSNSRFQSVFAFLSLRSLSLQQTCYTSLPVISTRKATIRRFRTFLSITPVCTDRVKPLFSMIELIRIHIHILAPYMLDSLNNYPASRLLLHVRSALAEHFTLGPASRNMPVQGRPKFCTTEHFPRLL